MKLVCSIPSPIHHYDIEIGKGSLLQQAAYLSALASRFAIIADDQIASYSQQLKQSLSASGLKVDLLTFPSGEQNKNRSTKEGLENQLFEKGFGHDSCVIALGGGVTLDVGGFVAATYCRGVPLVLIPTTLLAMVDACIGGKTGINVPYGKNMLGCIYHPRKVVIDPALLHSLPTREFVQGVVEMIKHGLIADQKFFHFLDTNVNQLLARDPAVLETAIFESCRIKKEIVEHDIRNNGKRHLLNFGHTIGHALEQFTDYSLPHGEAIAIGILVESYLSVQLNTLQAHSFQRIQELLKKYALPLPLSQQVPVQAMLDAMSLDKKSLKGEPRFVMIDEIGSSLAFADKYCTHVEERFIKNAVEWMNRELGGI